MELDEVCGVSQPSSISPSPTICQAANMSPTSDPTPTKADAKGETEHYEMEEPSLAPELTDLQKEIVVVAALSEEEYALAEKKLVRKIDLRLLPTLFILLVLNYLDRNALA